MMRGEIARVAVSWFFYIVGFILLERWFGDWRLGLVILAFIAGNNIEKSKYF